MSELVLLKQITILTGMLLIKLIKSSNKVLLYFFIYTDLILSIERLNIDLGILLIVHFQKSIL